MVPRRSAKTPKISMISTSPMVVLSEEEGFNKYLYFGVRTRVQNKGVTEVDKGELKVSYSV